MQMNACNETSGCLMKHINSQSVLLLEVTCSTLSILYCFARDSRPVHVSLHTLGILIWPFVT